MGMIVTIVVLAGLYIVGRVIGSGGNAPTISPSTNNIDLEACKSACDQWVLRRLNTCNAEKDEAAAKVRVDAARAQFLTVAATAVGAAAAASQVAGIPIIGPAAAAVLVAAAAALFAYAAYLLGVLGSAEVDHADKVKAAQGARAAEAEALDIMQKKCPPEEIALCMALPKPC